MALRKITEYPEKVLAEIGKPVTNFDKKLADLCADMFDTMYEAEGVGLAAPQIGLDLRLFVMDCEGVKLIAANPDVFIGVGNAVRAGTLPSAHLAAAHEVGDKLEAGSVPREEEGA